MAERGGTDSERRARGDGTRRGLVDAGRRLFVEKGYFGTSIGDLVTVSGVGTRGAFYHHFSDKAELFRAVFVEVEQDLTLRAVAAPPPGADAWERLTGGLQGFLDGALDREVQQIMLLDGPAVLGWRTLRTIQEGNSIAMIEQVVTEAMDARVIDAQPVSELTHMLVAVLEEAALIVAHSDDPAGARVRAARILDRVLLSFARDSRRTHRS